VIFRALSELLRHRDLLYILTWRDITVKYKQSVMGMLWAVLMPLVIVGAGLIVRTAFATASGTSVALNDMTSVAVKSVPWAFFVSALRFGTNSLVTNSTLVTKIYLPRLVFPLAAVFSQLFDFVVAAAVVAVLLIVAQVGLSVHLLWLPLLLASLVTLVIAFAIILSAASLFLRDVKYLVEVFLTFAIFITPVFYESSLFGQWAPVLLLNPVSPLLEGISTTLIFHQNPSLPWLLYSVIFSGLFLAAALAIFGRLEQYFAESV
jgi:homopolymeric O-antigen transport system permease protein